MIGCQLLSAAIGDDLIARLARAWRVLLRAIVPEPSLAYFHAVVVPSACYQPNSVWSLDHRQSPVIVTVKSFGSSSTDSG